MRVAVAGAGDVNGDGYDDVIVGAPYGYDGPFEEGIAYVFHGGGGGLDTERQRAADQEQRQQAAVFQKQQRMVDESIFWVVG